MFIRKKTLKKKLEQARKDGLWELVDLMRQKDKVYLNQVTLDRRRKHAIENCLIMTHPDATENCGIYIGETN